MYKKISEMPAPARFGKFLDVRDSHAIRYRVEPSNQYVSASLVAVIKNYSSEDRYEPDGDAPVIAEVLLGDPLGVARAAYEAYLTYELGIERGTTRYEQKLKKFRAAVGYSYP